MENGAFDTWTRSLSGAQPRSTTRRGMIRLLGGLALGGSLGLMARSPAEAKCKKTCGPCKRCKKGKCKAKVPDGTTCVGGTCQGGSCVAAAAPDPCARCSGDEICSGGTCIVPACGAGGPCRVFVSSTLYTGDLNGLVGADGKCQDLADAAGLPGRYKAWLSDSTGSPRTRFVPSTGPYRLVTGTTIAASFTDLTDGTLLAPITVTETGGGVGATFFVRTHTLIDGNAGGQTNEHCLNWSTGAVAANGDIGSASSSDAFWTDIGRASCSAPSHLYCFQQR